MQTTKTFSNLFHLFLYPFIIVILFTNLGMTQNPVYTQSYHANEGNPGALLTAGDYNSSSPWVLLFDKSQASNKWSSVVRINQNNSTDLANAFRFDFYGKTITGFKVSLNGVLTFDTLANTIPGDNTSMPTTALPTKSIAAYWDAFPTTGSDKNDYVYVSIIGSAPNRQIWVKWLQMKKGISPVLADQTFAVVLEESTSNIYVVDMNDQWNYPQAKSKYLNATVGIQNSENEGVLAGTSLYSKSYTDATTDNSYYQFTPTYVTLVSNKYYMGAYTRRGDNPNELNSNADNTLSNSTELIGASIKSNKWSDAQTLPFNFKFFGKKVSNFKVSANGLLTFTTSAQAVPGDNTALPSTILPNNTIVAFWDKFAVNAKGISGTGSDDKVIMSVIGSAPNRQLWVKWNSFALNGMADAYWAIVLEESSNAVYIVDQYNKFKSTATTASVGIQFDSKTAIDFGATFCLQAYEQPYWDNNYFSFIPTYQQPEVEYSLSTLQSSNPANAVGKVLNTFDDEPAKGSPASNGWTLISGANTNKENAWSSIQSLPFDFKFYGENVSEFKVNLNGLLTFNTATSSLSLKDNSDLPSTKVPDNSIVAFWDAFPNDGLQANDGVYSKIFGEAPYRQLWVMWYSMRTGYPSTPNHTWALVLNESDNGKFHIVDMYTPNGSSLRMTCGAQYNGGHAINAGSKFQLTSPSKAYTDNKFYTFSLPFSVTDVAGDETVLFDANDLDLGYTKKLSPSFSTTCLNKEVKKAYLVVKYNTGDVYNLGATSWTADVTFDVASSAKGSSVLTLSYPSSKKLSINQGTPEQVFVFDITADYEHIKNLELNISNRNSTISSDQLTFSIEKEVLVDMSNYLSKPIVSIKSVNGSDNPVTFEWESACTDVPMYELQVLKLFNTKDEAAYYSSDIIIHTKVDWKQAMDYVTKDDETSVKFTLAEGNGYYVWRVRPIGNYYEGGIANSNNWGKWSTSPAQDDAIDISLSMSIPSYVFYYNQFDDDKNWIFGRTFTEEGKIAEGITYASTTGQGKQTQRHLSENNSVLMSQSVTDYLGRPAIQTMTAPIEQLNTNDDTYLGYKDKIITDKSGNLYSPTVFDSDDKSTDALAHNQPIWHYPSPAYGPISDYYSDNNSDKTIPNAENYAFARTLYGPDGRVQKQSLFGKEHRLGFYDETYITGGLQRQYRTYYSAVGDTELLKVFGSETPADTSLYKIIRVDPNDLTSVEYKTLDGKTVATCLVQGAEEHPLVDYLDLETKNDRDSIVKDISVNQSLNDTLLVKEQIITLVEPNIQVNFDYRLDIGEFEAQCLNYCSNCDYDVYLYAIYEETGRVVFGDFDNDDTLDPFITITPSGYTINDGSGKSGTLECSIGENIDLRKIVDAAHLRFWASDPGSYRIGRRMVVRKKEYEEQHATAISALFDEEAEKFNVLTKLLDGDASLYFAMQAIGCTPTIRVVSSKLTDLYEYIECLPSGPSQAAIALGTTGILSGYNTTGIWLVKTNLDDTGDIESYTVGSCCAQIDVPKITCNWDPCDEIWQDCSGSGTCSNYAGASSTYQNLITTNKGYYDYEKMLTDKWGTTYGTDLYRYFYEKNGNYKYAPNVKTKGNGFNIKIYSEDNIAGDDAIIAARVNDGDPLPGNDTIRFNYTLYSGIVENDNKIADIQITVTDYEIFNSGSAVDIYYVKLGTLRKLITTYIEASLSQYGYTITYQYNWDSSKGLEYVDIMITNDDFGDSPLTTYNNHLSISYENIDDIDYNSSCSYETIDSSEPFTMGYGAFNALVNHMIFEGGYDCRDLYTIWEDMVEHWDELLAQKGDVTTGASGLDALEVFLDNAGRKLQGFSGSPYDNTASSSSDYYGYGYLEYAYRSFKGSKIVVADSKESKCMSKWGVNTTLAIDQWSQPDAEIYDATACGLAWWDGTAIVVDDTSKSMECNIWYQFHNCLVTDLPNDVNAEALSDYDLSAASNTYSDAFNIQLQTLGIENTKMMFESRYLGIRNKMLTKDTKLSKAQASIMAAMLIDKYTSDVDLAMDDNDGDDYIDYIGTEEQVKLHKELLSGKINLFEDADATSSRYKKITAKTYDASSACLFLLQHKFAAMSSSSELNSDMLKKLGEDVFKDLGFTFNPTIHFLAGSSTISITKKDFTTVSFSAVGNKIKLYATDGSTIVSENLFDLSSITESISIDAFEAELTDKLFNVNDTEVFHISTRINCDDWNIQYVKNAIAEDLQKAKEHKVNASLNNYYKACALPKNIVDKLHVSYTVAYHYYTLYYYDVTGNLVATVPPAGVDIFDRDTDGDHKIDAYPSRSDIKKHTLKTTYGYNSLGELTYKSSPDGGEEKLYYNKIGLLRFSQNAKQKAEGTYSYIKYDDLGRMIEVGKSIQYSYAFAEETDVSSFPDDATQCYEISITTYSSDYAAATTAQEHIQNRISYSLRDEDGDITTTTEQYLTYYSYDAHGNVKWIKQVIPYLGEKMIAYEYDLISSKVTMVRYNSGKTDQFFHRYSYDSDNRLTTVETSRDSIIWDTDASYQYYAHGPMKRLSIGEDHVQGLDYVYTINGWLKAINHQSLNATNDPGADGSTTTDYAQDVFGTTLGYFDGDFKRTGSPFNSDNLTYVGDASTSFGLGTMQQSWPKSADSKDLATNEVNYRPLFNGTITNQVENTVAIGSGQYDGQIKAYKYDYDQIYRLLHANFDYYNGSQWNRDALASAGTTVKDKEYDFYNAYTYDLIGNITSLKRNGYTSSTVPSNKMDNLSYSYNSGNNQLNMVYDTVNSIPFGIDLKSGQQKNNYKYNEIGQLTHDEAEGIKTITWNNLNKIDQVSKDTDGDGNSDQLITFSYDAMGNRVKKTLVKVYKGTSETTYYVKDATGKDMAIYSNDGSGIKFTEAPIYAGDRIGEFKDALAVSSATTTDTYTRTLGKKYYEIKDHLGNARVVLTDKKEPKSDGTYIANVASTTDYYPYGMEMPGRSYQSDDYRYGYQGKEKDNELKSNGNSYDFGARILDPRVGRWLSMDPLADKYASVSPYSAMGNNPMNMVDPDGKDIYYFERHESEWNIVYTHVATEKSVEVKYVYVYTHTNMFDLSQQERVIESQTMEELPEKVESDKKFLWNADMVNQGLQNIGEESSHVPSSGLPGIVTDKAKQIGSGGKGHRKTGETMTEKVARLKKEQLEETCPYINEEDPFPTLPPIIVPISQPKPKDYTNYFDQVNVKGNDGSATPLEGGGLKLEYDWQPGSVDYGSLRGDHTNYNQGINDNDLPESPYMDED